VEEEEEAAASEDQEVAEEDPGLATGTAKIAISATLRVVLLVTSVMRPSRGPRTRRYQNV